MTRDISDKEFEGVLKASDQERYAHFVKNVADWREVWSLKSKDGWVLYGSPDGHELIPLWPFRRYAESCKGNEWSDCDAINIGLETFVDRWIPGMIRDKKTLAIFPTPFGKGVPVLPERLKEDLEEELSKLE